MAPMPKFMAFLVLLNVPTIPASAQPKPLIEKCRMGTCYRVEHLGQRLLERSPDGNPYAVRSGISFWPQNTQPPQRPETTRETFVLCSTRKPTYIFSSFAGAPQRFTAHRLNPSGGWSGYNWDSHVTYWFVCHQQRADRLTAPSLARLARLLGYPAALPTDQVEGNTLAEILR
jgi:hypothetical protein